MLSGPGGSIVRLLEVTTGNIIWEVKLHTPEEAYLLEPETLGVAMAFSADESPDIFVLSNGRTITRLNGLSGAVVWSWTTRTCVCFEFLINWNVDGIFKVFGSAYPIRCDDFRHICRRVRERRQMVFCTYYLVGCRNWCRNCLPACPFDHHGRIQKHSLDPQCEYITLRSSGVDRIRHDEGFGVKPRAFEYITDPYRRVSKYRQCAAKLIRTVRGPHRK